MAEIGVFTPEQARLLWQDYLSRQQLNPRVSHNLPQRREIVGRPGRRLRVSIKADIFAAVDTDTDPSYGEAYVRRRKANGDLEITDDIIDVVNRFENISFDRGTYAKAEWIEGEWELYAADCPPADSSDFGGSSNLASSEIGP